MNLFDVIANNFKAAIGKDQEFYSLLASKDVTRARALMNSRSDEVLKAIAEYDVETHGIMNRPQKKVTDKNGKFIRWEDQWKLPIPYPAYINEIALVMLFGRPIKWKQKSKNTDEAFQYYTDLIKETRFDSKMRQCKRLAGKETESVLLFHCFRTELGERKMLLKVLAKSLGDEIYTRFDQYDRLTSLAWGYYIRENNKSIYHLDIFTPKIIYRCKKSNIGWEVTAEENLFGKIPAIYFRQDKEHKGVEPLIKREEHLMSTDADVNDYFASPAVVANKSIIENMPEKQEVGKLYINDGNEDGKGDPLYYLTWDAASEAKENEKKSLQQHILSKTFTPKIDWETMSGLSDMSGKALEQLFLPAYIKAEKNKEVYSEMIDRVASLFLAAIGNILDISLKAQCKQLIISHEFQKPFSDDMTESIKNLIDSYESGGMSRETFVELHPLIEDSVQELKRLMKEDEEKAERDRNVNVLEGSYI